MHFSLVLFLFFLLCFCVFLSPLIANWLVWVLGKADEKKSDVTATPFGISFAPMDWQTYFLSILLFHSVGLFFLAAILCLQGFLPLNPMGFGGMPLDLALNTAVSFVTNTNWQSYAGENTLSYFSQAVGLGTHNFVSAASGLAVMAALARAIRSSGEGLVGNYWQDLFKITLYFLLPLSLLVSLFLMGQGVVQNFAPYLKISSLEGFEQTIPMGPAASQIAIKLLGSNGGGFFGANSAHPFENPTYFSNALQLATILMVPMACPLAFGALAHHKRHGVTLFFVMLFLLMMSICLAIFGEFVFSSQSHLAVLEGKELRFGAELSVLWGVLTTATSNGSVNAMIASFSPITSGVCLLNIMLGEIIFGGVGSGVYGIFLFCLLTVFIAGLMVGRSPEFLGKKIGAQEIKWAVFGVLLPSALILAFSAISANLPLVQQSVSGHGPTVLTQLLYAFSSAAGNNGSAIGSLQQDTKFFNISIAVVMLIGRFGVILPVLALAGSLSKKVAVPESAGTFPAWGLTFGILLIGVLIVIGALTFFPALTLGPIVEHLIFIAQ